MTTPISAPIKPPTEEQILTSKIRATKEGVQVLELTPGLLYACPAKSNPGYAYTLQLRGPDCLPVCNCKGFTNYGCCKHLGAVLLRLENEAALDALTLAPAAPALEPESCPIGGGYTERDIDDLFAGGN